MKDFWDERYAAKEYAYGIEPNRFFKEQLADLEPGKILLPADGEGRNSVYAALKGWETYAFDYSSSAREKALDLAQQRGVDISYQVGAFEEVDYAKEQFDAVAFIFAHFPDPQRKNYHKKAVSWLKPGGTIILEAFSKGHTEWQQKYPQIGGPKNEALLYDEKELKEDFADLKIEALETNIADLSEGSYHVGRGKVVRLVAKKG